VPSRKKDRQALEHMREMWEASKRSAEDPGLREGYSQVPRLPVRLICARLDKEINHGNLLRIAEAYRIERVVFAPLEGRKRDFSGAMGAHVWQPYGWERPEDAIAQARRDGYTLYALDLSEGAADVHKQAWRFPLALVVGEELAGLPEGLREMCDHVIGIPLYGLMQSLNVAVAAGICLDQIASAAGRLDPRYGPVRAVSKRLVED
jgi:23S rRNA (guanosine2251-2'-O)-methyltransferase